MFSCYFKNYILPSRTIQTTPSLFAAKYMNVSYPECMYEFQAQCFKQKHTTDKEGYYQMSPGNQFLQT